MHEVAHCLQEIGGDAGTVKHRAHEDEERNGEQQFICQDAPYARPERQKQRRIELAEEAGDQREAKGYAAQGEGDGKTQKQGAEGEYQQKQRQRLADHGRCSGPGLTF